MSKVIKVLKVLRNNWKKSTFAFGILAYGSSYAVNRYKTFEMMRVYCLEAKKLGEETLPQMMKPKHVTVILNPQANNRKSVVQFDKFAAPLLHLAGFKVSVFQTEKEKQAQDLMQVMSNTDAVIVAGGNGTLHEVITGLLRRPDSEGFRVPLGIVPVGKTNTVAQYLFGSKSSSHSQLMAEAAMAVIRQNTLKLDVLKVESDADKPLYGMCSFEQGIFAEVEPLVQKYWYFGPLKKGYTYFRNSLKEWKPIENEGLEYVAPCPGCSKCFLSSQKKNQTPTPARWWQAFAPRKLEMKAAGNDTENSQHMTTRINENCGNQIAVCPRYSHLSIVTKVTADPVENNETNSLWMKVYPEDICTRNFAKAGLSHLQCKHQDSSGLADVLEARSVIIRSPSSKQSHENNSIPVASTEESNTESMTEKNSTETSKDEAQNDTLPHNKSSNQETFSYIDNEKYKLTSCSISLLPKLVTVYG